MDVLNPRFIDCAGAEHLRVGRLKRVFSIQRVIPCGRQAEAPRGNVALLIVSPILIPRGQRVVRRNLKIEALAHLSARARIGKRARKLRDLQRRWIHKRRVHHRQLVQVAPLGVGEKRYPFPQRAAQIPFVLCRIIAGRPSGAFEGVF